MKLVHDVCTALSGMADNRTWPTRPKILGFSLLCSIVAMFNVSLPSLIFGQATPGASKSTASSAGNVELGKQLFKRYGCYECHGDRGQITSRSGPALVPDLIPLEAFTAYIREPKGSMPPYPDKVASKKDLVDIYAFLQTTPRPPAAKAIPILNVVAGRP